MKKVVQLWHNTRCSKSRDANNWLIENKIEFEFVDYMKTPVSESQLKDLLQKLQIEPIDLVRKKEKLFVTEFKDKNLNNDQLVSIMVKNPSLIERPIVVVDGLAKIGRPLENIINLFE